MKEWITKGLTVIFAVLAPIKPLIIACGALILADMVTGIIAAKTRKEKLQSAEMRRSLSKMVVYQVAIISAFVLETYMLEGLLPVTKVVGGVIGMVEFKSILENASTIAGKDLVQLVIDKLGSKNAKGLK
jgi:phage-related holin